MERRHFLTTTGLAFSTVFAGCMATAPSGDPEGTDESTPTGMPTTTATPSVTPPDDPSPTSSPTSELLDVETIQFTTKTTAPSWFEDAGETVGTVIVIDSRDRTDVIWPHDDVPPERRDAVAAFLQDGNFEDSVLLFVESVAPTACPHQLDAAGFSIQNGTLHGTVDVTETGEGEQACAQVVTYPSALIRATFDGQPVTTATLDVTDGWGTEATISASADDPLPSDPADLAGVIRPDGDPAHIPPALSCDDPTVERLTRWVDEDDIEWGEATNGSGAPQFALRVDRPEVALGETVEITMTNVTGERRSTGNRFKYAFERYTEAGWQDVRVHSADDPLGYTDEAILHAPGDGFTWSFDLSVTGILENHVHEDSLKICPALGPGRYRFVFYEPTVAVAFDVVD